MSVHSDLRLATAQSASSTAREASFTIHDLPQELTTTILRNLEEIDSSTSRGVCRLWRDLTPTPAGLKIFGHKAWEKYYGLEIKDCPPIPEGIIEITTNLQEKLKVREEAPDCSLLLMPKGLTLNQLRELAEQPKMGYGSKFSKLCYKVSDVYGDQEIEESYWVLMTNSMIEESKMKTYAEQQALIQEKTEGVCQLPHLLEVAICCFMNHVSEDRYMFGWRPQIYTRCQEEIDDQHVFVGGYYESGLSIDRRVDSFTSSSYGIAACRRFDS